MGRSVLTLSLASLLLVGCGQPSGPAGAIPAGKLLVVATTGPVGDAVRNVGGDRVSVDVLMGPGIDPHMYNAVPSDLRKLDRANLVFFNGLHLEGRLGEAFERFGEKKPVVPVTGELESAKDSRLIHPDDYEGLHDPHVWHDVQLWSECVGHVADALCEHDPDGAATYRANAAAYQAKLTELHSNFQQRFAAIPASERMLVTAHDAFAYFSRAYGFESVGLKGVSTEDEVDLGQMEEVAAMLAERGAPCVFIESAVSPQIVEALIEACAAKGHEVRIGGELYADALGAVGSGAETYEGMMRANVETIAGGILGETPASAEPASE